MIAIAIEPKTRADEEKLAIALGKIAREDPSFRVRTDRETGQTLISGMGELHLEIIVDRLSREFGLGANIGNRRWLTRKRSEGPSGPKGNSSGSRAAAGSTAMSGWR